MRLTGGCWTGCCTDGGDGAAGDKRRGSGGALLIYPRHGVAGFANTHLRFIVDPHKHLGEVFGYDAKARVVAHIDGGCGPRAEPQRACAPSVYDVDAGRCIAQGDVLVYVNQVPVQQRWAEIAADEIDGGEVAGNGEVYVLFPAVYEALRCGRKVAQPFVAGVERPGAGQECFSEVFHISVCRILLCRR